MSRKLESLMIVKDESPQMVYQACIFIEVIEALGKMIRKYS